MSVDCGYMSSICDCLLFCVTYFLLKNTSHQGLPNHFSKLHTHTRARASVNTHIYPHFKHRPTTSLKGEAQHHLPCSPCQGNHSNPVLPPLAPSLAGGASWLHECCKESEWAQWHSARAQLNTALHHITRKARTHAYKCSEWWHVEAEIHSRCGQYLCGAGTWGHYIDNGKR